MASASVSPMTDLPTELLCIILSSLNPDDIKAARLVCRGFNDCAWPAFGASLRKNTFDLRSLRSWNNLLEISHNKHLSSYVSKLRFGCGFLSNNFPGPQELAHGDEDDSDGSLHLLEPKEYLLPTTLQELEQLRRTEPVAYPQLWTIPGKEENWNLNKSLALETLTAILSRFSNLKAVSFSNFLVPAHYRRVHDEIVNNELIAFDDPETGSNEHQIFDSLAIGLLLSALARQSTSIKNLAFSVRRLYHQTLATYAPADVLHKVLSKVETLKVRFTGWVIPEEHLEYGGHTVHLSRLVAPSLRRLVISSWHCKHRLPPSEHHDSGLSLALFPALEHLEIQWLPESLDQCFYNSLDGIGSTLKTLTIDYFIGCFRPDKTSGWIRFFEYLRGGTIHLDLLHIGLGYCLKNAYPEIPQRFFDGVAKEVVLPPAHRAAFEEHWAKTLVGANTMN